LDKVARNCFQPIEILSFQFASLMRRQMIVDQRTSVRRSKKYEEKMRQKQVHRSIMYASTTQSCGFRRSNGGGTFEWTMGEWVLRMGATLLLAVFLGHT
jgi:hypothetical protein